MRSLAIPSLRWRLVMVMGLAYIIVALVTELVGYTAQRSSLQHSLETRAQADAVILAAGAAHPLEYPSSGAIGTLQTFVESFRRGEGVLRADVYGADGCPIATSRDLAHEPCIHRGVTSARTKRLANGDVRGIAPISNDVNVFGTATVTLSGASVGTDLRNVLIANTVIRAVGLLIFLLLALMIARYLLAPLTVLARAANAIRHGNMASRISDVGGTELATVGQAFNEMASALETRIEHLSFLARTGSALPGTLRSKDDLTSILADFCSQLEACGVGLIPLDGPDESPVWYDVDAASTSWRATAAAARNMVTEPTALVAGGRALMVVPALGTSVFVAVRSGARPFSDEEQQVTTNFAYQLAIAADNARLFESQQEALQVKDQFLSIVSHELRTPLTTIKGYAQMLRRRLVDDPDAERFANNIDSQVSRLGRLVDDLLDVTRFARGQFELRRQRVDVRPLLEDVVARFRIVAPTSTFRLELDEGSYEGYWDRDRLEQVMSNLVSNAIKFSPSGGEIVVSTEHTDGTLVVRVRDQGIGIPEPDQGQLFERFYRGKERAKDVTGLGLGLYVTRRIVEAHGGTISVRSKPQEGSEFSFTLPLVRIAAATASR